jgi:SAM-dependent methyltransferase
MREISYLSDPTPVNMADSWYGIANLDHFWTRRRFQVLKRLAGPLIRRSVAMAEFGCGSGILQRQIEDNFGSPVAGFDLNELALQQNLSRSSQLYCYNVHERIPDLQSHFDLILLFDVLEHIDRQDAFLASVIHHLRPGGHLIINVPAEPWLYSDYDRAAGHVRRYSKHHLKEVGERNGLRIIRQSYWGLPMIPLLIARKWASLGKTEHEIITSGFDARSKLLNELLFWVSQYEWVPQGIAGTSVMATLKF